jgi:hypothetical protein
LHKNMLITYPWRKLLIKSSNKKLHDDHNTWLLHDYKIKENIFGLDTIDAWLLQVSI